MLVKVSTNLILLALHSMHGVGAITKAKTFITSFFSITELYFSQSKSNRTHHTASFLLNRSCLTVFFFDREFVVELCELLVNFLGLPPGV